MARSGHDFLQVHIDLLTGRVWLVPTFKPATAETAVCNYALTSIQPCEMMLWTDYLLLLSKLLILLV